MGKTDVAQSGTEGQRARQNKQGPSKAFRMEQSHVSSSMVGRTFPYMDRGE